MQIKGLENISPQQLSQEIMRGAKFVVFDYCISLLIITFKRPSGIYFIRADESAIVKSIGFTLLTLVLGWWGFPWGPIYTIASLITNFKGGRDVTMEVMNAIEGKPDHTTLI
ncbi:MAG: hypothetical protein ABWZ66_07395 [Pyrinomonadaceae bacterium]